MHIKSERELIATKNPPMFYFTYHFKVLGFMIALKKLSKSKTIN